MSYNKFAEYYDRLTKNVEYEKRCGYVLSLLKEHGNQGGKLIDLACGTGTASRFFAENGYSVTGIDLSEEMLAQASTKCSGNMTLIKADMTDFSLPFKADVCISLLDSINHITEKENLKKCFSSVYDSLNDGGLFIFDVNTVYKHRQILADNSFIFDEDDFFLAWDNEYEKENKTRILLDFFILNEKKYDRVSEEFYERAYTCNELKKALGKFKTAAIYDDMSKNSPNEKSERIYYVCKK